MCIECKDECHPKKPIATRKAVLDPHYIIQYTTKKKGGHFLGSRDRCQGTMLYLQELAKGAMLYFVYIQELAKGAMLDFVYLQELAKEAMLDSVNLQELAKGAML